MGLQLSTAVRNAILDQVEATISTAPHFRVGTGGAPADCAAADSGSNLIDLTLPSDWMAAASGGTKAKSGTWSGSATGTGTAGHFRIKDSAGTTCHAQGTAGTGTGDLSFDNASITSGQTVTISTFTLSAGNA